MEIKRRLRRVGNSVMLSIPSETLEESGFQEGQTVVLRSRFGHIEVEPAEGPDAEVAAFTARFVSRYREALQRLADL
jgi:antitoxin component of MazEF toxin-antitoxin module